MKRGRNESWVSSHSLERNEHLLLIVVIGRLPRAFLIQKVTQGALAGESMFNRAKLLNVGFKEALKDYEYNCFVFSDVDLIPMNDRNTYRCFSQPRHISVAMDKFGFRLAFKGMSVSRPNAVIGKCRMIRHSRDKKNEPNPQRFDRIAHTKETMLSDGLNTLTYLVLDVQRFPLYTEITVDIGTPS
ncbi:Beta-1,4-galactosyltransferase 1, partial [Eschrichtius robustus]|nr:Beta-1,4-galactosyltransferase 1 [Eschrichtius robustus]